MLAPDTSASAGAHTAWCCAQPDSSTTVRAAIPPALGATERKATKGVGAPW